MGNERALARQRAADERDLLRARCFARAVPAVAEEELDALDPTDPDRAGVTHPLAALRTDARALAKCCAWRPRQPLTRALVSAGRESNAQAQRELVRALIVRAA